MAANGENALRQAMHNDLAPHGATGHSQAYIQSQMIKNGGKMPLSLDAQGVKVAAANVKGRKDLNARRAREKQEAADAFFSGLTPDDVDKLTVAALLLQKTFRGKYSRLLTDELRHAHLNHALHQFQAWQEKNSNVDYQRLSSKFAKGPKFISKLQLPHARLPSPIIVMIGDAGTMSERRLARHRELFLDGVLA